MRSDNILINGVWENKISVFDRGLSYGDGIFETIAVIEQDLHNYSLHYQRFQKGAKRLGLKVPTEKSLLRDINKLIESTSENKFIVKIILTRGVGGRGYQCPKNQSENCIISINDWVEYPQSYYSDGINVQELDFKLSVQPLLAGIKHLNRLEQVLAKKLLEPSYQEAVLLNVSEYVIEGISSNIYFVYNNVLCIPKLNLSGVEGTIREQIIRQSKQLNIEYKIVNYPINTLIESEEIFYSNSIFGILPVKELKLLNQSHIKFLPGKIYHKLSSVINKQLKIH